MLGAGRPPSMRYLPVPGFGGVWYVAYYSISSGCFEAVLRCRRYLIALCEAERMNDAAYRKTCADSARQR